MLDFLLLILFTFISLCPYNAASTKYPYPVSAFFSEKCLQTVESLVLKGKTEEKAVTEKQEKGVPRGKILRGRPSVITRTCNQPQVLYQ